jgi:formylglycine-generating enzyme required for sulfatase activity
MMGSPVSELGHFGYGGPDESAEGPQHSVTVPPFYMGKYEVSQAQWRAVARLPKVSRDLPPDPSHFKGDNLPVENVSWNDAMEFCARLSRATGHTYRLPTEAEWEYACRAGTTTPFAFGETITPQLVNYNGNLPYGAAPKGTFREKTTPVGFFGVANAFGLYDMHGNVDEWCMDTLHLSYDGAPVDGSSWQGDDEENRIVRGGNYCCDYTGTAAGALLSRSAARNWQNQAEGSDLAGFRVVAVENPLKSKPAQPFDLFDRLVEFQIPTTEFAADCTDDAKVAEAVARKFSASSAFQPKGLHHSRHESPNISVAARAGVVTLTGTVAKASEKGLATRLAMRIPCVKKVDNQLIVR